MSINSNEKRVSFLLIEDDEDHAQLVIRSLRNNRVINRIDHINNGADAIDYLYAHGKYQSRELPDIILLDLKLPKIDGLEVLQKIKNDDVLKMIPVVVLTTSDAESDKTAAYLKHANSYLVKPLDFIRFRKMAEELNLYWAVWNQPPISKDC